MLKAAVKHWWFGLSLRRRAVVLFLAVAVGISSVLGAYASGRATLSRWRFLRDEARLLKAVDESKRRAADLEAKLAAQDAQLAALRQQYAEATARAAAADEALKLARNLTVNARSEYDQIRSQSSRTLVSVDVKSLCMKLKEMGYNCEVGQ